MHLNNNIVHLPEDKCWFSSALLLVHNLGPVVLVQLHLKELGDVEREGDHGDGHGVHQQPLCAAHCLHPGINLHHVTMLNEMVIVVTRMMMVMTTMMMMKVTV